MILPVWRHSAAYQAYCARGLGAQAQHLGKRGMSYHGAVIYVNRDAATTTCSVQGLEPSKYTIRTRRITLTSW